MVRSVSNLLRVLDVEPLGEDSFLGPTTPVARRRVFGGLVVAQALAAAARTVEGRAPHSLHSYFILPGDPAEPIRYDVARIRDGRSFATRRCVARQGSRTIFEMLASFQSEEGGLDHQVAMPDVPDPESLAHPADAPDRLGAVPAFLPAMRAWMDGQRAIAVRPCDPTRYSPGAAARTTNNVWMRVDGRLPEDPAVHRAALAYFSDLTLVDVALAAHGRTLFEPAFAAASLDHSVWFHRPFRADEWLLYAQDSPVTFGGRGLARGSLFDRAGRLVASVVQEGLIRLRRTS